MGSHCSQTMVAQAINQLSNPLRGQLLSTRHSDRIFKRALKFVNNRLPIVRLRASFNRVSYEHFVYIPLSYIELVIVCV